MKKSVPYFRTYLDVLSEVHSYAEVARRLRHHPTLVFVWLKKSREDQKADVADSIYKFCWPEDSVEPMWFHEHVRLTVSVSIEMIEAGARSRALHGTYSRAMFQGRSVYRLNPDWLDEEMRDFLGLSEKDMYLRDKNGDLVPEMVWTPPSTDLVMGVLAAHSSRYKRQSKIDIDMHSRHSGGVLVMAQTAPQPLAQPQRAIPMVEVISDEIAEEATPTSTSTSTSSDDHDDLGIGPATDTPDGLDDLDTIAPAQVAPEQPRVIRESPPPAYTPPPSSPILMTQAERSGRPLSDLERDLLARARGSTETRSANPVTPTFPQKTDRGR
jgi:hypothetical protein